MQSQGNSHNALNNVRHIGHLVIAALEAFAQANLRSRQSRCPGNWIVGVAAEPTVRTRQSDISLILECAFRNDGSLIVFEFNRVEVNVSVGPGEEIAGNSDGVVKGCGGLRPLRPTREPDAVRACTRARLEATAAGLAIADNVSRRSSSSNVRIVRCELTKRLLFGKDLILASSLLLLDQASTPGENQQDNGAMIMPTLLPVID